MSDSDSPLPTIAPVLLVSMPQLSDPNFHQTVILLCEHGKDGAFGLVLNRRTEMPASSAVRLSPPIEDDTGLELWIGGPVAPERGWILVGEEPPDVESIKVCDGIFLSTSQDLLRRLLVNTPSPHTRLLTGHAGWSPGQLDAELLASSWLTVEADRDIVFDTHPTRMWEKTIRRLGADPSLLQVGGGGVH